MTSFHSSLHTIILTQTQSIDKVFRNQLKKAKHVSLTVLCLNARKIFTDYNYGLIWSGCSAKTKVIVRRWSSLKMTTPISSPIS